MLRDDRVFCDLCKKEMVRTTVSEEGDELWPWKEAFAHVCDGCFDGAVDRAWDDFEACIKCETHPCERGRECWFEPALALPYETYYAKTVQAAEAVGGDDE